MSNTYENAVQTKMLASHCVICGRALVDAASVTAGVGPECRANLNLPEIDDSTRKAANKLVYDAAIAAQQGRIEDVLKFANEIEGLGLTVLADKVRNRFTKAADREADISIEVDGNFYVVKTPFRRGNKEAFINAWRNIPGRSFKAGANYVPVTQKAALWKVLRKFFGGKYGMGPKGLFRIPMPEPDPQMELKVA